MSTKLRMMFWGSAFVRTPLQNGIGRYVPQLQRITLKFCKTSGGSMGMRDYIEKSLLEFARENSGVVVYVKPRRHRSACLVAEYCNGGRDYVATHRFSRDDIAKWMELMRTKSGVPTKFLHKYQHTDFPSVQGPWTPFTHKDYAINLAQFPDEKLSVLREVRETGTEELVEMFERQRRVEEQKEGETNRERD